MKLNVSCQVRCRAQRNKPTLRQLHLTGRQMMQVYLDYARDYGCTLTEKEVLQNFRRAFSSPWTQTLTRYVGDGRPFW